MVGVTCELPGFQLLPQSPFKSLFLHKERSKAFYLLPLTGQGGKVEDVFQLATLVALMVSGGVFSTADESGVRRNVSFCAKQHTHKTHGLLLF